MEKQQESCQMLDASLLILNLLLFASSSTDQEKGFLSFADATMPIKVSSEIKYSTWTHLQLYMQVHNKGNAPVTLRFSMACHSAQSPVTPEVLTRCPEALPIGVITATTLIVPPDHVDEHQCGICLLVPGLYCLYAACIDILDSEGVPVQQPSTDELPVTIEPLYILVS
jgi:hypothetical protein